MGRKATFESTHQIGTQRLRKTMLNCIYAAIGLAMCCMLYVMISGIAEKYQRNATAKPSPATHTHAASQK